MIRKNYCDYNKSDDFTPGSDSRPNENKDCIIRSERFGSNFFDKRAIPIKDWPEIAKLVNAFETVIVENHPVLCSERILKFRDLIAGRLEIAMGLETTHPRLLKWLNKQMTLKQYQNSVDYLITNNIQVRSFILIKLPSLTEEEGIEWAVKSMEFAFDCGVECCSLVPVRVGNGFMDQLEKDGFFKAGLPIGKVDKNIPNVFNM